MIAAVVAADLNWGIGRKGELLTHIPNDLKHFKSLTENNTVIMGRKTWDSLPKKPLPNRKNIIISNTLDLHNENVECLNLEKGKEYIKRFIDANEKCFIIGGGIIYKEFFSFCQQIYLTKINKNFPQADTFFPEIKKDEWNEIPLTCPFVYKDFSYQFFRYDRVDF